MARGITIRIDRMEAVRLLGAKIRQETQEFERAKAAIPKHVAHTRKLLQRALRDIAAKIAKAKTLDSLKELAGKDLLDWKKRNTLPMTPQFNVCNMANHLKMLRLDERKVIPIGSTSYLWALLEGKCEVKRG